MAIHATKIPNISLIPDKSNSFGIKYEERNEGKFLNHLKNMVKEVNTDQQRSDAMSKNLASGKSQNIHETMLAISHAELSLKMMVQVRNKALEAYQEVMRMPV